jgi:hypothetical protein
MLLREGAKVRRISVIEARAQARRAVARLFETPPSTPAQVALWPTTSDIASQAIVSFPGICGSDRRALKALKMTQGGSGAAYFAGAPAQFGDVLGCDFRPEDEAYEAARFRHASLQHGSCRVASRRDRAAVGPSRWSVS